MTNYKAWLFYLSHARGAGEKNKRALKNDF